MNSNRKWLSFLDEAIEQAADKEMAAVIPKALTVAKLTGDIELEKWLRLESGGYHKTNPAFTADTNVPGYRTIAVEYRDAHNRPFRLTDPTLYTSMTQYPMRESITELEVLSNGTSVLMQFRNPHAVQGFKKVFGADLDRIVYRTSALKTLVQGARQTLIAMLVDKRSELASSHNVHAENDIPRELANLHPQVIETAGELFSNGHYRQAILDTYIMLVQSVKSKSGNVELDNTGLMQKVFSAKQPLLKVSNDPDEQIGFMWMFSGAVMGIRNPKAHRLIKVDDPQRALEWLSFASVLFRVLDDARVESS